MNGSGIAHRVGSIQLLGLAIGAILGAGWIVGVGEWIGQAGPLGTVIGFLGGAVVLCLVAACYADLESRFPATGGEVVYAAKIFGERTAYFTGWFLAIIYISVCAFSTISIGWLVEAIFPSALGPVLYSAFGLPIHLLGLLAGLTALALVTGINHRGIQATTRVQDLLLVAILLGTAVFVAAAIYGAHVDYALPLFADAGRSPGGGVLRVFITAPFWFSGFAVVAQALGEAGALVRPRRLFVIFAAPISVACLFYCLIVIATALVLPRSELLQSSLPAAAAFGRAFNSARVGQCVLVTGLVALLVALNSVFYAATRVIYSLGKSGLIPAVFGREGPLARCSTAAASFVAGTSALGTALGRGAVVPLVDASSIALAAIYLMVCFGTLRARIRDTERTPHETSFKKLAMPILACLVTALLLASALTAPWQAPHRVIPLEISLIVVGIFFGQVLRSWQLRRNSAIRRGTA